MKYTIAVGSYTRREGHVPDARGRGISILEIDDERHAAAVVQTISDLTNPSYLASTRDFLYCVSETPSGIGTTYSWRRTEEGYTGVPTTGNGPVLAGCHLLPVPERNLLATASYSGGSISLYALKDGLIASNIANHILSGHGPDRERQDAAHAHQVIADSEARYLFVPDLGSDTIWRLNLDTPETPPAAALKTPAGFGPRHMVFDTVTETVFIICELIPKLLTASFDPETGSLELLHSIDSTLPEYMDIAAPAAIKRHPSGHSLAVSNRFDDTITVFTIDRSNSVILRPADNFSCRGKTPRDMEFSDDGRILFIANQDSHDIQLKYFDRETGLPQDRWGPQINIGSPACVINIREF